MEPVISDFVDYEDGEEEEEEYLPDELQGVVTALVQFGKTTPQQIIQIPQCTIERIAKINSKQSANLLFHISKLVFKQKPMTVKQLLTNTKINKLPMGCPVINNILKGGILMQGITEISGESATGKTQFALQAMLQAILPEEHGGLGGAGLYLCTEDIPVTRWGQLVESYVNKYPNTDAELYNRNMYHCKVYSIQKLTEIIQGKVLPLIRTQNIKVLVIDSIAALFRCELGSIDQTQERTNTLHSHACILKQLSDENKIPILIINQVTDYFVNDLQIQGFNSNGVIPSLGLHWANSINMRIMLSKTKHVYREEAPTENNVNNKNNAESNEPLTKKRKTESISIGVRTMQVVFSPHLPNSSCYYLIDQDGVHGLELK
jgi:DNA-repair protein XRCC3